MTTNCLILKDSLEPQAANELLKTVDQAVNEVIMRDGWMELRAAQLSEAELNRAVHMSRIEDDEQTRFFTTFLGVATNFSSASFADRLSSVPKVVKSIADLLDEMRREVAEFTYIANEFEQLVQTFNKLVIDTKHKMGLILPHMCEARDHIGVLTDVFKPSDNNLLTTADYDDIKIATGGLVHGMKKMIDLSRASSKEGSQLNERIARLKTDVRTRRSTVKGRIHISKALNFLGPLAGAGIVARAVMTMVAAKEFGGVGMLVVAGCTFTPLTAIICGALLGGSIILAITGLIYHCWTRHQHKALIFLNKICTGLMELSNANIFFLDCLSKSEEAANTISVQLEQIQRSITSERYRKCNAELCKKALESVDQAIKAIEDIKNIDVSRWFVLQSLPQFDDLKLALTASENP
ncbi:unnamed protein product [Adineta steineri]|uniref:Uncharacterized protein n=1 Tax=Adineta steineri TaxID=433720 RepID=A0A813WQ57_9BILA|nr:unnamed protein product [Adineta steineri]CAF3997172.1 unnamed protein product [Adineta steineri]